MTASIQKVMKCLGERIRLTKDYIPLKKVITAIEFVVGQSSLGIYAHIVYLGYEDTPGNTGLTLESMLSAHRAQPLRARLKYVGQQTVTISLLDFPATPQISSIIEQDYGKSWCVVELPEPPLTLEDEKKFTNAFNKTFMSFDFASPDPVPTGVMKFSVDGTMQVHLGDGKWKDIK